MYSLTIVARVTTKNIREIEKNKTRERKESAMVIVRGMCAHVEPE